jgi:hypothetical protein
MLIILSKCNILLRRRYTARRYSECSGYAECRCFDVWLYVECNYAESYYIFITTSTAMLSVVMLSDFFTNFCNPNVMTMMRGFQLCVVMLTVLIMTLC